MHGTLYATVLASVLSVSLSVPAAAAGLMDSITSQAAKSLGGGETASQPASGLGGLLGSGAGASAIPGLPSLGGDTAGNAAGVLQYCLEHKYLGGTDATSIKDSLLSKAGLGSTQKQQEDAGYQKGLGGILSGSDGSSFDLGKIKDQIKDKVCDYVLNNASSLL